MVLYNITQNIVKLFFFCSRGEQTYQGNDSQCSRF